MTLTVDPADRRFSIDSEDEEELEASDGLEEKEAQNLALGEISSDRTSLVDEDDSYLKQSDNLGEDSVADGAAHARSEFEDEARRNCTGGPESNSAFKTFLF